MFFGLFCIGYNELAQKRSRATQLDSGGEGGELVEGGYQGNRRHDSAQLFDGAGQMFLKSRPSDFKTLPHFFFAPVPKYCSGASGLNLFAPKLFLLIRDTFNMNKLGLLPSAAVEAGLQGICLVPHSKH